MLATVKLSEGRRVLVDNVLSSVTKGLATPVEGHGVAGPTRLMAAGGALQGHAPPRASSILQLCQARTRWQVSCCPRASVSPLEKPCLGRITARPLKAVLGPGVTNIGS